MENNNEWRKSLMISAAVLIGYTHMPDGETDEQKLQQRILRLNEIQCGKIIKIWVFSGRELAFTFAIYYRPSVCLSVCNVGAPYSGG